MMEFTIFSTNFLATISELSGVPKQSCQYPTVHYIDCNDFDRIRELIRRAFAIDADANAWSFAHFDIWSQRQVGREQVLHQTGWHKDICLWEEGGLLYGAAIFDTDCSVLILDPTHSGLAAVMLDWLEAHWTIQPSPRSTPDAGSVREQYPPLFKVGGSWISV
jgi:hypothetical protein